MILACNNINKTFVTGQVLKNCSFHIEEKEKVAIVGMNGAGKSTLLKIINNEISSDSGDVVISKNTTLGYLSQHQDFVSSNTIYDEMLSVKKHLVDMENKIRDIETKIPTLKGKELEELLDTYSKLNARFEYENGYAYKSEIMGVINGLGFTEDDFNKSVSDLSGGQKTRVALGKLLLSTPDIIMLDEPTNHLDISSVAWLETFLSNYKGAVVIVAHDRYFLDKIVTKVVEIDRSKVTTFSGNYSDYAVKKKMLRDTELKAYLNQQQEIQHHEAVISKLKSFNREKSIKRAESREKMLDKIEVLDKPVEVNDEMRIQLKPHVISGNDVLSVVNLSKSFAPLHLFSNLSFEIKRGEKVALIGDNGTGKTTILKIINNIIEADSGEFKLGAKVHVGYYDQEHNVLHSDKTLFNEISDEYPTLTNTEIRNVLAAFLFTGDDVFKKISDLSGGERGRVSLAKLMLSEANFLILDEPTNHLDVTSKEILENALNSYTGTVLYVSHDRYFINQTASRILELKNNSIINYIGNYDYYIEKVQELTQINNNTIAKNTFDSNVSSSKSKTDWKTQKEEQARQRKIDSRLAEVETLIMNLESENTDLDKELLDPSNATNANKLNTLHTQYTENAEQLETLYVEWETLQD